MAMDATSPSDSERMPLKMTNAVHPSYQSNGRSSPLAVSHASMPLSIPSTAPSTASAHSVSSSSPSVADIPPHVLALRQMKERRTPMSMADRRRKNPFRYDTPLTTYERIKIGVMCLLGVPLVRVLLLLVVLVVVILLAAIAMVGYHARDPVTHKKLPLPLWRRVVISPLPFFTRVALFIVGFYWIPVKNAPRKDELPRIIISNHISFIDGLFFASYLFPSIAMKEDVANIPLVGNIIKSLTPILINRRTPEGRKKALKDIEEHLNTPELPPLLIFPEGTTSNQDYLTKFKIGSFSSGLPCQPVAIRYPYKHFDLSWTPHVSAVHLGLRMLCQVYNCLEVEFLPVYTPTDQERQFPDLYAENVRQVMAQAMHVECTNHAFEDVALLLEVGSYVEHHVMTVTDVGEITNLTSLRGTDVEKLVKYFAKRDLDRDGQFSRDELTRLFPQENEEVLTRLFELLDLDGNGQIDFRELCLGLTALNPKQQSTERLVQFAFRLYDMDGNGIIDGKELEHMLRFTQRFYGVDPASIESTVDSLVGDKSEPVTFARFEQLITQQPELLGYAKSKLEILRGSFREC